QAWPPGRVPRRPDGPAGRRPHPDRVHLPQPRRAAAPPLHRAGSRMKPQKGSRTAGVIDGILALLRDDGGNPEEYALAAVEVLDGPVIESGATKNDVVQVAPGDDGEPAVITQRIPQPGLGR